MWKDNGPHYKNFAVVGSVGMHVVDKHYLDSSYINHGPASHWRGNLDSKLGTNNMELSHAVAGREVINIDDYIDVLQDCSTQ